ncbi:MAG: AAA family ATPase [Candidatus Altiarchaeales archaeon]|nr:AAA family ATPase [Candidatus Altiarchaeales archaeon]
MAPFSRRKRKNSGLKISNEKQKTVEESPVFNILKASPRAMTKKEYAQALSKFLLNEYGSPDFIIDVTESIISLALRLRPRSKRFQTALTIFKYATPACVLTSELYSKVKRFNEMLNEPTEVYNEREQAIRKLLGLCANPLDAGPLDRGLDNTRFFLGKEIATWIAERPKTTRFKIRSFHAPNKKQEVLEDPFVSDSHDAFILLEYKGEKYVLEILYDMGGLDIFIRDMWIYTPARAGAHISIDEFEKEIYAEFIAQFDVNKNVLLYSSSLSTRPRQEFRESLNQFDLESFESEVYKVLKRGKKRGYAFVGIPGTGKSTIIRKMELHFKNYPIVYLSPDSFSGPSVVERTFNMLRLVQPCIVVLEDLDSYDFRKKNETLGVFLDRIDDVNRSLNAVFIATINDTSLVHYSLINRPGRLDEVIMIQAPSTSSEVYEVLKIRFEKNKAEEDNIQGDFPSFEEIDKAIFEDIISQRFTQADICEIIEKSLLMGDSITNKILQESVVSLKKSKEAIKACNFHEDSPYEDDPHTLDGVDEDRVDDSNEKLPAEENSPIREKGPSSITFSVE